MIKPIVRDIFFLGQKAEPAVKADMAVGRDLFDTLQANRDRCVGMAANMIGVKKRIIAFLDESGRTPTYTVMLNPEIIKKDGAYDTEEGTISGDLEINGSTSVEKVIEQYVSVINTCDTTLCGQIWSREDEVSFIAPSGHYTSYQAIRDSLVVGLFGTRFTQRELRKKSVRITINGNSAWSEFYWTFDATKTDGAPHHTRGLETQIFKKSPADGSWKLVHIHYSSVK